MGARNQAMAGREIQIDGCSHYQFEVFSRDVKLDLYRMKGDSKEPVTQLVMPEAGAEELFYSLVGALPPEIVMKILRETFAPKATH